MTEVFVVVARSLYSAVVLHETTGRQRNDDWRFAAVVRGWLRQCEPVAGACGCQSRTESGGYNQLPATDRVSGRQHLSGIQFAGRRSVCGSGCGYLVIVAGIDYDNGRPVLSLQLRDADHDGRARLVVRAALGPYRCDNRHSGFR